MPQLKPPRTVILVYSKVLSPALVSKVPPPSVSIRSICEAIGRITGTDRQFHPDWNILNSLFFSISAQMPKQNDRSEQWPWQPIDSPPRVEFHPLFNFHICCGLWFWSVAFSNQISGIIEQLFLISGAQPPPLFGRVLVPALSHGTLIVINYHKRTVGDVIEYTSDISIVFASTVCSDQVHTFLWYISCLSSYGKLLVIISSWPKGCYVIEVSGGWMYRDRTIDESEYW